jgi:chitodextrinase
MRGIPMEIRFMNLRYAPSTHLTRLLAKTPLLALLAVAACSDAGMSEESSQQESAMDAICSAPLWQDGVAYDVGQKVRYAGRGYRCLQAHHSLSTWAPSVVPALWGDLGEFDCSGGTVTPPGTGGNGSCNLDSWGSGVAYAVGDEVRHEGEHYRCLQAHTSIASWAPDEVPALWSHMGHDPCAGGAGTGGSGGSSGTGGTGGSGTGGSSTGGSSTGGSGTGGSSTGGSGTGGSSTGGSGGGGVVGGTEYAPYFYTWGWGNTDYAFTDLVDMHAKAGVEGVTLAFVLADGGCAATRDIQQHQADVQAFRAGGGRVKVSFGGANGTYLENACSSSQQLASALRDFVDETGLTDLDFDVEQGGAMNAAVNARRSEALRTVQTERGISVSFTLAAMPRDKWDTPGGITAAGLDVLSSALAAQVQLHRVNLMTMDYGGYYSDGRAMGELANSALIDAHAQLEQLLPGASDAQLWGMLGATPMIGQNDVASEVFTLTDAQTVAAFAKQKGLGLVSFWAIQRDQPCPYDSLGLCSKVNTADFQFHDVLSSVLVP